jgi:hypothetical protein
MSNKNPEVACKYFPAVDLPFPQAIFLRKLQRFEQTRDRHPTICNAQEI